ncbi:MAG: hypothetical protein N2690_12450, partial [Rhodocyclaceae bacterium]|nr:hypothetical protein [Rhodocyclaceae bacterium]
MTQQIVSEVGIYHLTNGRLEVIISDSGAGQLRFNGLPLNRWSDDPIEDALGSLLYIRDLEDGALWSLGYQPTRVIPEAYQTGADQGHFWLERQDRGIRLQLELRLDSDLGLERRRVRIHNRSDRPRRLELTS